MACNFEKNVRSPYFSHCHKRNLSCIKDLHVKNKIIKILEENIRKISKPQHMKGLSKHNRKSRSHK